MLLVCGLLYFLQDILHSSIILHNGKMCTSNSVCIHMNQNICRVKDRCASKHTHATSAYTHGHTQTYTLLLAHKVSLAKRTLSFLYSFITLDAIALGIQDSFQYIPVIWVYQIT